MKASELIEILAELKAKHGDLEVAFSCANIDPVMDAYGNIESVDFEAFGNVWNGEDLFMIHD